MPSRSLLSGHHSHPIDRSGSHRHHRSHHHRQQQREETPLLHPHEHEDTAIYSEDLVEDRPPAGISNTGTRRRRGLRGLFGSRSASSSRSLSPVPSHLLNSRRTWNHPSSSAAAAAAGDGNDVGRRRWSGGGGARGGAAGGIDTRRIRVPKQQQQQKSSDHNNHKNLMSNIGIGPSASSASGGLLSHQSSSTTALHVPFGAPIPAKPSAQSSSHQNHAPPAAAVTVYSPTTTSTAIATAAAAEVEPQGQKSRTPPRGGLRLLQKTRKNRNKAKSLTPPKIRGGGLRLAAAVRNITPPRQASSSFPAGTAPLVPENARDTSKRERPFPVPIRRRKQRPDAQDPPEERPGSYDLGEGEEEEKKSDDNNTMSSDIGDDEFAVHHHHHPNNQFEVELVHDDSAEYRYHDDDVEDTTDRKIKSQHRRQQRLPGVASRTARTGVDGNADDVSPESTSVMRMSAADGDGKPKGPMMMKGEEDLRAAFSGEFFPPADDSHDDEDETYDESAVSNASTNDSSSAPSPAAEKVDGDGDDSTTFRSLPPTPTVATSASLHRSPTDTMTSATGTGGGTGSGHNALTWVGGTTVTETGMTAGTLSTPQHHKTLKQILSRPFGRSSLPPEVSRKIVAEVGNPEWDSQLQQYKYRVLVQRRQLKNGNNATSPSENKNDGNKDGDDSRRKKDGAQQQVSSFTAAYTWRTLADLEWLSNELNVEFHGGLLIPTLSLESMLSQSRSANANYGSSPVNTKRSRPVPASLYRDWLNDVLNGIRGQGELILEIPPTHFVSDILQSESIETFLYKSDLPATSSLNNGGNGDGSGKSVGRSIHRDGRGNNNSVVDGYDGYDDPPYMCGGENDQTARGPNLNSCSSPTKTASSLLHALWNRPLELCVGPEPDWIRESRQLSRQQRHNGSPPQQPQYPGTPENRRHLHGNNDDCYCTPPRAAAGAAAAAAASLPLELLGACSASRAQPYTADGVGDDNYSIGVDDSTIASYDQSVTTATKPGPSSPSTAAPPTTLPAGSTSASSSLSPQPPKVNDSNNNPHSTSQLIQAGAELALNYHKTSTSALSKLKALRHDEELIGQYWKRFACAMINLFAYEKDAEDKKLMGSTVKRENLPYRKIAKARVEETANLLARCKSERSVPALAMLQKMLQAYSADLHSVGPAVESYKRGCKEAYTDQGRDELLEAYYEMTTGGDEDDTCNDDHPGEKNLNGSAWALPPRGGSWEERIKALAARGMGTTQKNMDSKRRKDVHRRKRLQERLKTNEQLLRYSLTALCRSTPIRVARMTWRHWSTEASRCSAINAAAVNLKSKIDLASKDSVSKMARRHAQEEQEDRIAELDLITRIISIQNRFNKTNGKDDGVRVGDVEANSSRHSEERSRAVRRGKALDIAQERVGRWDSKLSLAIMEAVEVDDPNLPVEETTRELRLVRKYAIGLREHVNRSLEAVQYLQAIYSKTNATLLSGSAAAGNGRHTANQQGGGVPEKRKEFLKELSKLFSGKLVAEGPGRVPKRSAPSMAVLAKAGVDTSDPFGWGVAVKELQSQPASAQSPPPSPCHNNHQGRVGELAVAYLNARDAHMERMLKSMHDLLTDYFTRVEEIEGFVYMECVGIQLERHFSQRRSKALSAFEKKTDITTAVSFFWCCMSLSITWRALIGPPTKSHSLILNTFITTESFCRSTLQRESDWRNW